MSVRQSADCLPFVSQLMHPRVENMSRTHWRSDPTWEKITPYMLTVNSNLPHKQTVASSGELITNVTVYSTSWIIPMYALLEGQSSKQKGQCQNCTMQYVIHKQWKKTMLAWIYDTNGSPADTLLHWEVPQYKRGPNCLCIKYKLEEHSQQGLVKDGNHLGGSRGGSL